MGKHSIRKPHPGVARFLSILGVLAIVIALALSALLVVPGLAGMNAFCIATGSMEPAIPTGSLVLVESVNPQTIEEGDVVSYVDGADQDVLVTHRVVANDTAEWTLTTQGDANAQPDPLSVSYGQVVGKVVFDVPVAGYVALAISTPVGKLAIAALVIVGILLCLAADRLRRTR